MQTAKQVLKRLEWSGRYSYCTGWPCCPICKGIQPGYGKDKRGISPDNAGHRETCDLVNALKVGAGWTVHNADITGLASAQGPVNGRDGQPNAEFSRRVWLNPDGHVSTGSVVVFDGPSTWLDEQGKPETERLVEIADCRGKVRLHQAKTDTLDQFTTKVRLLRDVLSEFLEHLDKVPNVEVTS